MKKILHILFLWAICVSIYAQTIQITISDPATWSTTDLAPYVGKTVTFTTPFYVTNNYNFSSKKLTISPRRIFIPTNQAFPNTPAYTTLISANQNATVTLTNQNTYRRMGEMILNLTVNVQSTSTLVPVGTPTFYGNTRNDLQTHDDIGEYNLKVCGFNMEYYLVENLGSGTIGPTTTTQQNAQHTKIMKAMLAIDADIYGLVEIEQGQAALTKLANSLNQAKGTNTYTYINDGGAANGTYTKSAYLYNSAVVEPYGAIQHNNTGVVNRKKLQAFTLKSNGEKFVLSINHFKAKSNTGTGSDADQGDGQGGFNATRVTEAKSVINQLKDKANYFDDEDFLIIGDLNAYAKEDPIKAFLDAGYYDLHRVFHADTSYSYVYRGQAGYLDHALANGTMYEQISGMTAYKINSDEHDNYTYNSSWNDGSMFRCSDHDPIIVGLMLGQRNSALLPFQERIKINTLEFYKGESPLLITNAINGNLNANIYLRLYTISGILLQQKRIDSDNYVVNTQDLSTGIYILHIFGEGIRLQTKLIVP